jgi:elongation factor 1-alpha
MKDGIYSFTSKGERKNIEFKESLKKDHHLKTDRKRQLASQMKYRMERGDGEAIYLVGVYDDGELKGLDGEEMDESLFVLRQIAQEAGAKFSEVEKHPGGKGEVAKVIITRQTNGKRKHMLIGVAGHVDHGKSTLIGSITTGALDNGSGGTRIFLDVQKHEIERGLSADLSFAVYGFQQEKPIKLKNPLNKREKSKMVETSDKLISFVDTVGHEPWLRTTIRGIVGQKLDYGLLVIAADQGPTHITKEHLGIMLAMELPVLVVLTKIDLVPPERSIEVQREIFELLKLVGRIPYKVKDFNDADFIAENMNQHLVPFIETSPVSGEGLCILDRLFFCLKKPHQDDSLKPFMMYIDKIYSVLGVGTVVSGTVRQGKVLKGDDLLIGPMNNGKFVPVSPKTIEMHHYRKESAEVGDVVGISITGVNMDDLRRGMIICSPKYEPKAVREFEAEVAILVHPTTITKGYECITHIETMAETTWLQPLDKNYLSAGDTGKIKMRFKYRPCAIHVGQKLIFREGRSKGYGEITKIY